MNDTPAFFEIGAKTNFSFLEGAARPEEMVFAASAQGLSGLGIADRNSVAGVVRAFTKVRDMKARFKRAEEFGQEEVLKENPEPILRPVPVQPGARLVFSDDTPDILAYPENRQGWANLCRLLSRGNLRTEKGSCILEEWDLLEWCREMQLAVIPDFSRVEDPEYTADFGRRLDLYREKFGKSIYLALSPTYDGRDKLVFASFAQIASRSRIPLIATNMPLFNFPYRRSLSDIVTAIREHVTIQEAGFRLAPNGERYVKPAAEMARLLHAYPDAISNTEKFFRN